MGETTFADAVLKVFTCAIVDAHNAARKNDRDTETEFRNVATALQIAYPREARAAQSAIEGSTEKRPATP